VIGHILGIPLEESVLPLVPAGAVMMAAAAVAGRMGLDRLRRRLRHRHAADREQGPVDASAR
jgi:hypothetical protein